MRARTCGKPGCKGIIRDNVCSVCGEVKRSGWRDDRWRGTATNRGYDVVWSRLRRVVIEDATMRAAVRGLSAFPICEICSQPIEDTSEIDVDHIEPFKGRDDPLRLNRDNLRVLHRACHMRRHRTTQRGGEGLSF